MPNGVEYRIGDALEALRNLPPASAQFIHLDDAWARPNRNGAFGVEYATHPFDSDAADDVADEPGVVTHLTVTDMLDASYRALDSGGILAVDTDSYLLSKTLEYATEQYGTHAFAIAQTTALTNDGDPDCSTPGMYLSTGGYATVFIWKDAAPLPTDHPTNPPHTLHCACKRQREDYGWGTVKPLAPFEQWIQTYTEPGDRIVVPCAGTAPAAIAAELHHGDDANVLCIDTEPEAKAAYERRSSDELTRQTGLGQF
jgi:hypothetical protein